MLFILFLNILTEFKSFLAILLKCNILRTVPSGKIWNESSNKACSFHHDTLGGGIPPLDKHVKFIFDPSVYGPTTLSVTAAPNVSNIISCDGGTIYKCKKKKRRKIIQNTNYKRYSNLLYDIYNNTHVIHINLYKVRI